MRARTVSGRRGYMYASSTAGLFYFMNRNISRDNWTRGARPPLNCLHTWPCAYRVCHTPYPVYDARTTTLATTIALHRVASRRVASRRVASRPSPPRRHYVGRNDIYMQHRLLEQCKLERRLKKRQNVILGPNSYKTHLCRKNVDNNWMLDWRDDSSS